MHQFLLKVYTVLILVTVGTVVWFGFRVMTNSAVSTAQVQPLQKKTTETMNNTSLTILLESENLRVDAAVLLPAQTDQSNTIFVRFTSDSLSELSAQLAENVEVSLLKLKNKTGALSRQRVLELSPNQILVVAVNAQKQVLWWNLQPDPRVFRAETSDDAGHLSGQTLYRQETEMLVSLPDDAAIKEVRFYHPVWDGISDFSLKQIGGLNF